MRQVEKCFHLRLMAGLGGGIPFHPSGRVGQPQRGSSLVASSGTKTRGGRFSTTRTEITPRSATTRFSGKARSSWRRGFCESRLRDRPCRPTIVGNGWRFWIGRRPRTSNGGKARGSSSCIYRTRWPRRGRRRNTPRGLEACGQGAWRRNWRRPQEPGRRWGRIAKRVRDENRRLGHPEGGRIRLALRTGRSRLWRMASWLSMPMGSSIRR